MLVIISIHLKSYLIFIDNSWYSIHDHVLGKIEVITSSNDLPTILFSSIQSNLSKLYLWVEEEDPRRWHVMISSCRTTIESTLRAIKNTLTYSDLYSIEDICAIERISIKHISIEYQNICLNQYSKLLAIRLLREVYFEASYPFVIIANLYLQHIFKKIALYRSGSSD